MAEAAEAAEGPLLLFLARMQRKAAAVVVVVVVEGQLLLWVPFPVERPVLEVEEVAVGEVQKQAHLFSRLQ